MWKTEIRSCADVTISHYSHLLCCRRQHSCSYSPVKIYLSLLACSWIPPRCPASNVTWPLTNACMQMGNCYSPFPTPPYKAASEKSKWVSDPKRHSCQSSSYASWTDWSGTRQGSPHLPLWFRLVLSGFICLLLLLPIDSSWHPLGTASSCLSVCCPPPQLVNLYGMKA